MIIHFVIYCFGKDPLGDLKGLSKEFNIDMFKSVLLLSFRLQV